MFIASKTFSHSFSALHKYHMMLKRLARNEGAKVQLLQILFDMWRDHPQMLVVLVDKCIRLAVCFLNSINLTPKNQGPNRRPGFCGTLGLLARYGQVLQPVLHLGDFARDNYENEPPRQSRPRRVRFYFVACSQCKCEDGRR